MRTPAFPPLPADAQPPLWPPLLPTRGPGGASDGHAHHAMHIPVALRGRLRLRVRVGDGEWQTAAGVVTPPDVAHAVDARGLEILSRIFVEQWITFPRYVLSGRFAARWRGESAGAPVKDRRI